VRSLLALPAGVAPTEAHLAAQMNASGLPAELAMYYRAILGLPQPGEAAAVFGAMAHTARASGLTEAVRELILRKAIGGPLLLVLEDVHWSKPELLTMLAALLPDVQQLPLVWVLSSRFEHDPLDAALRPYLNGLAMTVFDLATLRSSEALALAAQSGNPDPDFHAQCVARAQGNPLFLTQLLLSGRSGALPSSVKNLVQTKLDRLSSPQRRALRVASAIGQRFSAELLSQVLGQADDGLEVAVRHCLVRPAEPGSYVFVHDLVMHGVYESMSPSQRATVHHAIALCYPPGEPLRAQHLHRARHADAPAAYLAAIADRIAAFQYPQALDLLEQCQRIDYAELDDCAVNLLAGECHAKMGQTQRAKASYSAALAQAAGRDQHIAAVLGLARALNLLEDMDAEERLLDQAIADFGNAGGGDGVSELYYLKGNIYFPRGNFTLSRQLHQQAQRHAQSKGSEARALSGIGDSYYAQGRILTAHTVFIECLGLCERYGLADIEASNRFMLGTVRLYLNQTNDALADALASAELGRRVGNRRAEIVSRLTAGWALISSGQAGRAREQIELGLALARKIGAARFEPFLNESLARVLLIEGNRGEALELALQAWDMVQRQKLQHFIGPWVLGTVALLTPAAADCRRALQQGQELLDEGCVGHNYYRYYASAMEASLMHGELDQALAYADRFDAYLADERCPWAVHQLALVRASASWMGAPQADAAAELATLLQHGQHAGLGQVMPLLHQHLLARLPAR
jgi:tetratricopeptide (TPR) repeat protein